MDYVFWKNGQLSVSPQKRITRQCKVQKWDHGCTGGSLQHCLKHTNWRGTLVIQLNLSWETTAMGHHLSRRTTQHSWQKVPHFLASEAVNKDHLSWDHIFIANWGNLSRQVLLYDGNTSNWNVQNYIYIYIYKLQIWYYRINVLIEVPTRLHR